MTVQLRWAGEADYDRVAEARARSFGHSPKDESRFRDGVRNDPRAKAGDFLLAEYDGEPIGTTTALDMTMWVRGGAHACQGVAYVGTTKTHRRGSGPAGAGVASRLMHETLRMARERGQVLSALMPFRVSFYEHFGYGIVERRHDWTVPMSILPHEPVDGFEFATADDPRIIETRLRMARSGQCDIERTATGAAAYRSWQDDHFIYVDRGAPDTDASYAVCRREEKDGRGVLGVVDWGAASPRGLRHLLRFFASLRDQYSAVALGLPSDLPLNRLLREHHLVYRSWNHPSASCVPTSRMMVRVLDHAKLLGGMRVSDAVGGEVVVAVGECEGHTSRLRLTIGAGRIDVTTTDASPGFACTDTTWAAVACGELPASTAVRLGLADGDPRHAALLDVLSHGPAPFCQEYF